MKKILAVIVLFVLLVSGSLAEPENPHHYDKLQYLFSMLTFDTTMEEVEEYLTDNNLVYFKDKYNGTPAKYTYKIALTEQDIFSQSSRDRVEINFNRSNGELLYANYENSKSLLIALIYQYGTYWDLNEKEPDNDYAGIYYYKPGGKQSGITISYKNGRKKETPYIKCADIDEALEYVINPQDE